MRNGLLCRVPSHNNPNLMINNSGKVAQKLQTFKCFCSSRTLVFVWMKLKCKLLIRLPDITVCSFLGHAKDLIIVLTFLNPEMNKDECFLQNVTKNKFSVIIIIKCFHHSYLSFHRSSHLHSLL